MSSFVNTVVKKVKAVGSAVLSGSFFLHFAN